MLRPSILAARPVEEGGGDEWLLDFTTSTYTHNGSPVVLTDVIGGPGFDPLAIEPDEGMKVADDNSNRPDAIGDLLAAIVDPAGVTVVVEWDSNGYEYTYSYAVTVINGDFSAGWLVNPNYASSRTNVDVYTEPTATLQDLVAPNRPGANRAAFTLTPTGAALSVNGRAAVLNGQARDISGLTRVMIGWVDGDPVTTGYIRKLEVYSPRDVTDLPGLSALP